MTIMESIIEPSLNPVRKEAVELVDAFICKHRAAAIPSLVGVIVAWAVEHGAADTMRNTLRRAIDLTDSIEEIYLEENSRKDN